MKNSAPTKPKTATPPEAMIRWPGPPHEEHKTRRKRVRNKPRSCLRAHAFRAPWTCSGIRNSAFRIQNVMP